MSEPAFQTIRLEVDPDGVAVLTFARPEVRNALDEAMVGEVHRALDLLAARDDVRAVVLTGEGKAFMSGADVAELRERGRLDALRRINTGLFRRVEQHPTPTIAALRGWALGGGCELALACDLRVCGAGAKLGQPEVGLGIIPGAGATYRLPRLVGQGMARELIFTGRVLDAQEALAIGLVNRVVPDDDVVHAARELAREIARNGALAVRLAKAALNLGPEASTEALQAFEAMAQAVLFEDEEKRRRMTAFLERRAAGRAGAPPAPVGPAVRLHGRCEAGELLLDVPALRALPEQVPDAAAIVPGKPGRAVRLAAALAAARPLPEAAHVVVEGRDGRVRTSLPLAQAARALLVHALPDGGPLPSGQGGPVRLLVPDAADPCQHVKDVARIELVAEAGEHACAHTAKG